MCGCVGVGVGVSGTWYTGLGCKHFNCPSLSTVEPQSVMLFPIKYPVSCHP